MQYPKLTVFLTLAALLLGQALFAEPAHESILYRTADAVSEATESAIKRIDWRVTRRQAARGDACAMGRVATAHYFGDRLVDFEYSGLEFDRARAAELFQRSAELGCEETEDMILFLDVTWPDDLAPYRDDGGRVDWQRVQAAASTGDPDARYHIATTMRRSRNQARMRGIEYDPERGTDMLRRLAREGHMDALLDVARDGRGITPNLNRAYYALMDTTWKPLSTLRIHLRLLQTAIEDCNPSAWAKSMDIWSVMSADVRASDVVDRMIGDAHGRYLSTCSGAALAHQ